MTALSANMAKIQVALESKATVKNEKGEIIALPSIADYRTEDCIRIFPKGCGVFYWSSAERQKELFVNGLPFDEWFELQPIGV